MVKVTHKSTGLGLEVTPTIWAEEHEIITLSYAKTLFFDVDGKTYTPSTGTFGGLGSPSTLRELSTATYEHIRGDADICPANGRARSITVKLARAVAGDNNVKCAIYKFSDLSLVGYTEEVLVSLTISGVFYTFNFTAPGPSLTENEQYLLVVWADYTDSIIYFVAADTGGTGRYKAETYNSFPDPLVTPTSSGRDVHIYCTYEEGYNEIPATRVKVANDYIKPSHARIIARASGDATGTKKLKIHDGNTDVAEVTWSASGVQDLVSNWIVYTDELDRTMSVWFQRSSIAETFTLYNVALEMR